MHGYKIQHRPKDNPSQAWRDSGGSSLATRSDAAAKAERLRDINPGNYYRYVEFFNLSEGAA